MAKGGAGALAVMTVNTAAVRYGGDISGLYQEILELAHPI